MILKAANVVPMLYCVIQMSLSSNDMVGSLKRTF